MAGVKIGVLASPQHLDDEFDDCIDGNMLSITGEAQVRIANVEIVPCPYVDSVVEGR